MRYLVLLGDGMADFPLAELDGRTPLEAAFTPAMDEMAKRGMSGLFCPIPANLPPGSDIGNLSMFGYNPNETFTGRAPLEAANQGISLADDQVAFRCNLVSLGDGLMRDLSSGHITTEEAAVLIAALNEALSKYPVKFHPGVSYRHLAIVTAGAISAEDLARIDCTPPHNIPDKPYADYLPQGAGSDLINALIRQSQPVLEKHPVNAARIANGKAPATSAWLWGQGRAPSLATYRDRFGISGAVISAVDLVNGIGVCAGFEVIRVPGATGYLDTNYEGKVSAALDALNRHDFVFVHVEAPDETSHQGRTDLKIQAINDFDRRIVAPCLEYAHRAGDVRVLVAPDHITAISTRTHAGGPVPFALCGPGITPNGCRAYNEREAAAKGVLFPDGYRLVPFMLGQPVSN
ncbi:MAG: cofactor-independent phosphoglycerate mutase [Candidatus Hydrogenedentes bacterium]|nr:cofactor-independent phosphoglycerate mutase [Candidatus Hydrogenedentota bacterium]